MSYFSTGYLGYAFDIMMDDTTVSEIFTCSPWDSCVLVGIYGEYPCLICVQGTLGTPLIFI